MALVAFALVAGLTAAAGLWFYRPHQPEYYLRRGQELLSQGDVIRAEAMADRLDSSGYPDHAHLLRGLTFLTLRRPNDAIREYNQIRQTNDAIITEASVRFGLSFLSYGETQRARKLFLGVLDTHPDNLDARKGLGALYYDQGAMDFALRQLHRWAELDPADGQPHRFLGRTYSEMEESPRAIAHYQTALTLSLTPKVREEVTVELAELFIGRKAYADALARLDGCSLESVEPETVAELRAECLSGLGRHAEAAQLLEASASTRPPSPRRLRLEASVQSEAGDLKPAADLLERALRMAPHDTTCREQLAVIYERQDRQADAARERRLLAESQKRFKTLSELKRKANRRANDPEVRRQLAALCEQLGKPEWAARWLHAAELCPKQDEVLDE